MAALPCGDDRRAVVVAVVPRVAHAWWVACLRGECGRARAASSSAASTCSRRSGRWRPQRWCARERCSPSTGAWACPTPRCSVASRTATRSPAQVTPPATTTCCTAGTRSRARSGTASGTSATTRRCTTRTAPATSAACPTPSTASITGRHVASSGAPCWPTSAAGAPRWACRCSTTAPTPSSPTS